MKKHQFVSFENKTYVVLDFDTTGDVVALHEWKFALRTYLVREYLSEIGPTKWISTAKFFDCAEAI